ncbi:MAG: hypothetical protein E7414_01205 [Ruminococcaceae bacterium]|nr:hypothetical protein [Oscillospiraceae bacterium]
MYQVQKKKRRWPLFILLFLCAFAVGMGIGYGGIKMNRERSLNNEPPRPAQTSSAQPGATEPPELAAALTTVLPAETPVPLVSEHYFVKEEAGEVCVFSVDEIGEKRFSHKLPIALKDLREEDRRLFREGIYLDSKQALLELTEDFSS